MKRQLFYALAAMAAFLPVSCASTSKAGADSVSPFEKVGLNGSEVPYTVLAKTNDGVEIQNGGYGSDACAHPTDSSLFYLVTDRGPNIDFKGNSGKGKMFPVSSYAPRIGRFLGQDFWLYLIFPSFTYQSQKIRCGKNLYK